MNKIYYKINFKGSMSWLFKSMVKVEGYDKCNLEESLDKDGHCQKISIFSNEQEKPFLQLALNNNRYEAKINGWLLKLMVGELAPEEIKRCLDILNFVRSAEVGDFFKDQTEEGKEIYIKAKKQLELDNLPVVYLEGFFKDNDEEKEIKFWVAKEGKWKNQIIKTVFSLPPTWFLLKGLRIIAQIYSK